MMYSVSPPFTHTHCSFYFQLTVTTKELPLSCPASVKENSLALIGSAASVSVAVGTEEGGI